MHKSAYPVGGEPLGLTFDGANIWVANWSDNTVTKLRAKDGTGIRTLMVDQSPTDAAFDGSSIWVTSYGSNTVDKISRVR